jgi:hypothetical protein
MDGTLDLTAVLQREVEAYAEGETYKSLTYALSDPARGAFAVLVVPDRDFPVPQRPGIVVAARIVGAQIIIDEDITDRPLWEALERAGVPRAQIICGYAGEAMGDESPHQA